MSFDIDDEEEGDVDEVWAAGAMVAILPRPRAGVSASAIIFSLSLGRGYFLVM